MLIKLLLFGVTHVATKVDIENITKRTATTTKWQKKRCDKMGKESGRMERNKGINTKSSNMGVCFAFYSFIWCAEQIAMHAHTFKTFIAVNESENAYQFHFLCLYISFRKLLSTAINSYFYDIYTNHVFNIRCQCLSLTVQRFVLVWIASGDNVRFGIGSRL